MTPSPDPHHRHRFPAELISHAVWLYHVFSLSLRDVERMKTAGMARWIIGSLSIEELALVVRGQRERHLLVHHADLAQQVPGIPRFGWRLAFE